MTNRKWSKIKLFSAFTINKQPIDIENYCKVLNVLIVRNIVAVN